MLVTYYAVIYIFPTQAIPSSSPDEKQTIYLWKRHTLCDDTITGWWNYTYLSLAFVYSRESDYLTFWVFYFGIINWVDDVNWPLLRFSRLTCWALALRQSKIFLRHSLWRRVDARNVSFENRNGGQFTLSLSWWYQIIFLYPPTDTAPQFLLKLTPFTH